MVVGMKPLRQALMSLLCNFISITLSPPLFPSRRSRIIDTMTQIGFFPTPGEHITFEKPKHTEWTIIAKLNEKDVKDGFGPSFALARSKL